RKSGMGRLAAPTPHRTRKGRPAMTEVASLAMEGEVAVLTVDNPPVNALSTAVRQGVQARLRKALADPQAKAVVLICAGRTFFAGADITEFGKPPVSPMLPELVDEIEAS